MVKVSFLSCKNGMRDDEYGVSSVAGGADDVGLSSVACAREVDVFARQR